MALTRPPRLHDGSRDLELAVAELRERLPEPLAALARLAFNYRWTWLPDGATVFSIPRQTPRQGQASCSTHARAGLSEV